MLPRRNLAESSRPSAPNPRAFILLRTLCPFRKSQTLWNQANTSSLAKTPRVGCGPAKLSSKISDLQTLRRQPVCKPVTPGPAGIDLHVPCFHTVTNPSFRKSFIFTSICIAPCFFSAQPVEAIDARIPKSGILVEFGMGAESGTNRQEPKANGRLRWGGRTAAG